MPTVTHNEFNVVFQCEYVTYTYDIKSSSPCTSWTGPSGSRSLKLPEFLDIRHIFFFCWRYNPLWVLAFSVIFFHSVLFLLSFLHPLIPIVWISSSTSSIQLFLCLPLILLPIGFHSNILLGILPPSIRVLARLFFCSL